MQQTLRRLVAEMTVELSDTLIAVKEFTEPRSLRIIAPCLAQLEDGKKRLQGLEKRLDIITEHQLRAELITIVRNLLRTFNQLKNTQLVDPSWYEGEAGSGIPQAIAGARKSLGI